MAHSWNDVSLRFFLLKSWTDSVCSVHTTVHWALRHSGVPDGPHPTVGAQHVERDSSVRGCTRAQSFEFIHVIGLVIYCNAVYQGHLFSILRGNTRAVG